MGRFPHWRTSIRSSKNIWNRNILGWITCFGFGAFHCSTVGIWVSDPYGLTGHVEKVAPVWGAEGFNPFNAGGIVANHIGAGLLGIIGGIFHITNRPGERLYRALKLGSLERSCKCSSCCSFCIFVVAGTMWYGSATTPLNYLAN